MSLTLENLLRNTANLSIEQFQIFCDNIYNYSNIHEDINRTTSMYSICAYLDNLLDGPQHEMASSFLMSFSLYFEKNKSRMEKMALYFYDLIPECMFYLSENEQPHFHRLLKPIERQTNYQPPDHRNNEILVFNSQLSEYIDDNNSLHSGINYYIDKITLEIMELHSSIMVLELARYGKYSGTALDIIINNIHDDLMKKQSEIKSWISFVSTIPKQNTETSIENHDYSLCSQLHIKRQILDYNHTYGLPKSVLLEAAHNPHLWKYVNRKKLRHSVFRTIELKPPEIANEIGRAHV